jgi:hypothetical protein
MQMFFKLINGIHPFAQDTGVFGDSDLVDGPAAASKHSSGPWKPANDVKRPGSRR